MNKMETQKQTLVAPTKAKGMLISFDQADFNTAKTEAQKVIPAITDLLNAYKLLEPEKPFDDKQFEAFVNGNGAEDAIGRFKDLVSKDFSVFKNPISRQEVETKINFYAGQIHDPLIRVKNQLAHFNSTSSYKLNPKDFSITEGGVALKTDGLQNHYSKFLTTDTQVEGYKKLHAVALAYNDLIEFFDKTGVKTPWGADIMNYFFAREVIGENFLGPQLGNRIEVFKRHLADLK
jgi:hypothetical protein